MFSLTWRHKYVTLCFLHSKALTRKTVPKVPLTFGELSAVSRRGKAATLHLLLTVLSIIGITPFFIDGIVFRPFAIYSVKDVSFFSEIM